MVLRLGPANLFLLSVAAGVCLCCSRAHCGEVWTNDGRVIEGVVRISNRGAFSVALPGGSTTILKPEEAIYAWFGSTRGPFALALPSPLKAYAIGSGKPGALTLSDGEYNFKTAAMPGTTAPATREGGGSSPSLDDCDFFGREINGSTELGLRISQGDAINATVGLTIRESLDPGAKHMTLLISPAGDVTVKYRQETGGPTLEVPPPKIEKPKNAAVVQAKPKFPLQVKLLRRGRNCTWFKRTEEQNWWSPSGQLYAEWQYDQWLSSDRRKPEPGVGMGSTAYGGVLVVPITAGEARVSVRDVRVRDGLSEPNTEVPGSLGDSFISARAEETAKGIWLSDATFFAGASIRQLDGQEVRFDDGAATPYAVTSSKLARANLTDLPVGLAANIPSGGNGVLLASGEFMDGQLKRFGQDAITVSSVVFGLSTFKAPQEAKALAWRSASEAGARWMVAMRDGGCMAAKSLRGEQADVLIDEPLLGIRRVPAREIYCIRRGADVAVPVAFLRPQKFSGRTQGREAIAASCFDPVWGNWLTANGRGSVFGVAAPIGSELVYEIPSGSSRLVGWLSVAERIGGGAGDMRVAVIVDKKKVLDTTLRKTKGDYGIAPINLPVSGGKTLVLRLEGQEKSTDCYGIWGDAMFLRN